jgi:predicted transcriptional regulator
MVRFKSMAQAWPHKTTLRERDQHRMTIRVPTEVHEALLILGRARGWSLNTIVVRALHEYLSKNATWEPVEDWLRRTAERYRAAIGHLVEAEVEGDPLVGL